ncbi:hypothetical protein ACFL2M_00250 [Patescibacteria group bacterium]
MKIIILVPGHSYGRSHIFLSGSATSIAARLLAMGHEVDLVDLNIDPLHSSFTASHLAKADLVGISLTGPPDIPSVCSELPVLKALAPQAQLLLGGQVIEHLTNEQFVRVFGSDVVQISDDRSLAAVLGCTVDEIPASNDVPFWPVWKRLGLERMELYMRHEMTLVVSQGCKFNCSFCAASKSQRESFRAVGVFEADLRWMADAAKAAGLTRLEFYASSLDFFQNPNSVAELLRVMADVRAETGLDIRTRCLSCIISFSHAAAVSFYGFPLRLKQAGLWCVGFGADGADATIWQAQWKRHNSVDELHYCFGLCRKYDLRAELLMVFGYPEDTVWTLAKAVATSIWFAFFKGNVLVHPYLAKSAVPGNKHWNEGGAHVEQIVSRPELFQHLDFAALGSRYTHPRTLHRWACNAAYLALIALLTPFGKNVTLPILPQGEKGLWRAVTRWFNWWMPFDR